MTGKRLSFGESSSGAFSLNLTALMDILSNLLFFLLASYTAQDLEVKRSDLTLPASISNDKVVETLMVTVTRSEIIVGQEAIAQIQESRVVGVNDEDPQITPLYNKLRNIKLTRERDTQYQDATARDSFLLMADKSSDSVLIAKVLKTAGAAGFVRVRFGVLSQ
ncbi:MAG: biopolymer transporter ExbD [Pseudomonadota bacterium]